jgi:hypothetical protein
MRTGPTEYQASIRGFPGIIDGIIKNYYVLHEGLKGCFNSVNALHRGRSSSGSVGGAVNWRKCFALSGATMF